MHKTQVYLEWALMAVIYCLALYQRIHKCTLKELATDLEAKMRRLRLLWVYVNTCNRLPRVVKIFNCDFEKMKAANVLQKCWNYVMPWKINLQRK